MRKDKGNGTRSESNQRSMQRRTDGLRRWLAGGVVLASTSFMMPVALRAATIDAAKHGAVPDDGQDDTAAIQAAIDAAVKSPGSVVRLKTGVYELSAGGGGGQPPACLSLADAKRFTFDGAGAELRCTGVVHTFAVQGGESITFRNLTIDWSRAPFSVGAVEAVGERSFDVRVRDAFPVQGGEPVTAFMDHDPATGLPYRNGLDSYHNVERTELIGPQMLRVQLKNPVKIQTGSLVVLRHQVYHANAFHIDSARKLRFEDVTVYTAPGMGLFAHRCDDVSLRRFRVLIRPGTPRLMSTTADATHFRACAGLIEMEGCEFEGMGDDATNVFSLFLSVREKLDDRTVTASHNLKIPSAPRKGERMDLRTTDDLLEYGQGVVAEAEELNAEGLCRVRFTQPLPAQLKVGDLLGNRSRMAKVRIRDCSVRRNRARGFLLKTDDAIVEDCVFEDCTSGGVWALTECVFFFDGVGASNTIIRRNTFRNCNYGGPIGEGVISAYGYLADFKFPPKPGIHRNIVIEDNVIEGADNCAIFVTSTDGLVVRNNEIRQACRQPTKELFHAAIRLLSTRNAEFSGNRVPADEQGAGFREALAIGEGCDPATITAQPEWK